MPQASSLMRSQNSRLFGAWRWSRPRSPASCFELLGADSKISTLNKIRRALETAGVRFIDEDEIEGPGVRLQKGQPAGKRK